MSVFGREMAILRPKFLLASKKAGAANYLKTKGGFRFFVIAAAVLGLFGPIPALAIKRGKCLSRLISKNAVKFAD